MQREREGEPRGGGTVIFSYIRRLGPFFLGQNFEFQCFLGVFRKLFFFFFWGGGEILWILVITKLDYI